MATQDWSPIEEFVQKMISAMMRGQKFYPTPEEEEFRINNADLIEARLKEVQAGIVNSQLEGSRFRQQNAVEQGVDPELLKRKSRDPYKVKPQKLGNDLYAIGAKAGMTRQEVEAWRAPRKLTGGRAIAAFMREFLPGWDERTIYNFQDDEQADTIGQQKGRGGALAPWQWAQMTEAQRAMSISALPHEQNAPLPPDRFQASKGWSVETEAVLGRTDTALRGGKRLKAEVGHDIFKLSDLPTVRTGPKAGPLSSVADETQIINAAISMGVGATGNELGEPGVGGFGLIDAGGTENRRVSSTIYLKDKLSDEDERRFVGQSWREGRVAEWLPGINGRRSNFSQKLEDVIYGGVVKKGKHKGEHEYIGVITESIPSVMGNLKSHDPKAQLQVGAGLLKGYSLHGQQFQGFQLQGFFGGSKRDEAYIMGMLEAELIQASPERRSEIFAELGLEPQAGEAILSEQGLRGLRPMAVERFTTGIGGREPLMNKLTTLMDQPLSGVHKSNLPFFEKTMLKDTLQPMPDDPERFSFTNRIPVVAAPMTMRFTHTWDWKEARVPYLQAEQMRRDMPRTFKRFFGYSQYKSRPYQDIVQAAWATQAAAQPTRKYLNRRSGEVFTAKAGTIDIGEPWVKAIYERALIETERQLKAQYPEGFNEQVFAGAFAKMLGNVYLPAMAESGLSREEFLALPKEERLARLKATGDRSLRGKFQVAKVGERMAVLPPIENNPYWSAPGSLKGEDASIYSQRYVDLARAVVGGTSLEKAIFGDYTEKGKKRKGLADIISEVGGSEETAKAATAFYMPDEFATGRTLYSNLGFAPGEAFVPGMAPGPFIIGKSPLSSEFTSNIFYNIGSGELRKRDKNADIEHMQVSSYGFTAIGGDADGDTALALLAGNDWKMVGPYEIRHKRTGQKLNINENIIERAKKMQMRGHASQTANRIEFAGLDRAREAMVSRLEGLKGESYITAGELIGEHQQKVANIGPTYNVGMKLIGGGLTPEAQKAGELLHEIMYGFAQRPKDVPKGLQPITNAMRGWFDQNQMARYMGKKGSELISSAYSGAEGVVHGVIHGAASILGETGEGKAALTAEQFAMAFMPPDVVNKTNIDYLRNWQERWKDADENQRFDLAQELFQEVKKRGGGLGNLIARSDVFRTIIGEMALRSKGMGTATHPEWMGLEGFVEVGEKNRAFKDAISKRTSLEDRYNASQLSGINTMGLAAPGSLPGYEAPQAAAATAETAATAAAPSHKPYTYSKTEYLEAKQRFTLAQKKWYDHLVAHKDVDILSPEGKEWQEAREEFDKIESAYLAQGGGAGQPPSGGPPAPPATGETPEDRDDRIKKTQSFYRSNRGRGSSGNTEISYDLIRKAESAAKAMGKYGESLVKGTESTDKLSKKQESLFKVFEDYEKTADTLTRRVSSLSHSMRAREEAKEEISQDEKIRLRDASNALRNLIFSPGFATMRGRLGDWKASAEERKLQEALAGGGAGGGGGGGGGRWGTSPGGILGMFGTGDIGWGLFQAQRVWRWTGGAVNNWMDQYAKEQMLAQSINYNVGLGGQLTGAPLEVLRRRAQISYMTSGLGKAASNLMGPTIDAVVQYITQLPEGQQENIIKAIMGFGGVTLAGLGISMAGAKAGQFAGQLARGITRISLAGGGVSELSSPVAGAGAVGAATFYKYGQTGAQYIAEQLGVDWNKLPGIAQYAIRAYGGMQTVLGPTSVAGGLTGIAGLFKSAQESPVNNFIADLLAQSKTFQNIGNTLSNMPIIGNLLRSTAEMVRSYSGSNPQYGRTSGWRDVGASAPTTDATTNIDEIIKAMVEFGLAPEETYALVNSMTSGTGRKPTLGEVKSKASLAQVAGTTPTAMVNQTQGIAGMFGAIQGTESYAKIFNQFWNQDISPSRQQQIVAAANLLQPNISALISQGQITPEEALPAVREWSSTRADILPQMQLAVPAMDQLFGAYGLTRSQDSLMATVSREKGGFGYTQAQVNRAASIYPTQLGWSLRQAAAAGSAKNAFGGEGWQYGFHEYSPLWGLQERGFAAQFERQENIGRAQHQASVLGAEGSLQLHRAMMDMTKELRNNTKAMIGETRAYQKQQHAFAVERAEMQYRQSLESLGLQEQMFATRTAQQRTEFAIQEERMPIQQEWQRQNMSYQASMAGLQYGWQQEDLQRNIRFATGRERQQLIRQMQRGQMTYSMEAAQRGRERSRFETQADWQKEDLERQKANFEEITALQQAQFDMQRRHLEENHELQMRQLQAEAEHMKNVWALEDDRRVIEEKYQDKQQEFQEDQLERQVEIAKMSAADFEATIANQKTLAAETKKFLDDTYGDILTSDGSINSAFEDLFDDIKRWIKEARDLLYPPTGGDEKPPNGPPNPPTEEEENYPPGFASGGIVTKPTRAIIGEAGPEAVIPLNKLFGSSVNQAIQVAVYLGDEDITNLVSTRIVKAPAFIKGLDTLARRQANTRM